MMMSRWLSAAALAAVLPAVVALPGNATAALTYGLSLGAGVEFSDNFYNDPEPFAEGQREPVKETTYSILPTVRLDWESPHDQLRLGYAGEISTYTGGENLDARWTHTLNTSLAWRRWSPFFFETSDTLTREPQPQVRDVQSRYDYTYTNIFTVRTGLVREFGARGAAELAYRGELETYPDVEDADRVQRHYGEGSAHYNWTPLVSSEFRASYGRIERELTSDYDELDLRAAVNQRFSEQLALQYSLEWIRDSYEASSTDEAGANRGDDTTLLKSVALSWDLRSGGSWRLAYGETLDYLEDGDTVETKRASADVVFRARLGSSLSAGIWYENLDYELRTRQETPWGATLAAHWVLLPWLACDVGGEWSKNKIEEDAVANVDEDYYRASAGIVAAAGRHITLRVGYQYQQNDSDDESRAYRTNEVSAWATYHLRALMPGSFTSIVDDTEEHR